jgi:hypothetical protein
VSALRDQAPLKEVKLNAASFFLTSVLYLSINTENLKNISTLLNSGSTDCFIDSRFTIDNQLLIENLKNPLCLTLFDGSVASQGLIVQSTTLDIQFPCGTQHQVCFLLTLLDKSATAVLGYTWLHCYNPSIDWVTHPISFQASAKTSPLSRAHPELSSPIQLPDAVDSLSTLQPPDPGPSAALCAAAAMIPVSFISSHAINIMAQLAKSHPSSIVSASVIRSTTCYAHASNTAPDSSSSDPALHAELEELHPHLPSKYQPYTDVFSKRKGTTLPPQ